MSDIDTVRRIHDAALELGAECPADCVFAKTSQKSYAALRAQALSFLIALDRSG